MISKNKMMKGMLEKNLVGKRKMLGLTTIVKGRLRGMTRKRKKTAKYGVLMLQNKNSTLNFGKGCIYTKYGTIGIKTQSVQGRERPALVKKIGVLSLDNWVKKELKNIAKQAKALNIQPIEVNTPSKKSNKKLNKKLNKNTATRKAVKKTVLNRKAAKKVVIKKKSAKKVAVKRKTVIKKVGRKAAGRKIAGRKTAGKK